LASNFFEMQKNNKEKEDEKKEKDEEYVCDERHYTY
jgi:hypothetical protein